MRANFAAILIGFGALLSGGLACKKADSAWLERYKRSARADIDLYLVPERNGVLESSWLKKTAKSRFNKQELERALRENGRTLADVQKNPAYEYKEENGEVTMRVGRISHSTAYDYDVDIPLVFHGKWFVPVQKTVVAYQQHIAPTIARILGVRNPNGATLAPLPILSEEKSKPEIVVVVVIDQGGRELLRVHKPVAPRIHALMESSANMTDAQVGHLDAHTAVGHMAIGTGAFPVKSTVIGNTFFRLEKANGKQILRKDEIYSVKNETQVSTEELRSETLADVVNEVNGGKSVIISQSYALRAAIGMAGHGSAPLTTSGGNAALVAANNYVYWLDATQSRWVTDKRYYTMPRAVPGADVFSAYTKNYPGGFEGYSIRDPRSATENWGVMMSTPVETRLEGDLFRAVLTEEIIAKKKHNDGVTDLVYVSFKSADAVGHHFGYHSLEAKSTLAAIDNEIGALQDFLIKHYGDRYVLVLTADHGCAALSEITGGSRLTVEEVIAAVDSMLPADVAATESLIRFMTVGQVALNRELMGKHSITLEAIRDKIRQVKAGDRQFFKAVLTRKDLGLDG